MTTETIDKLFLELSQFTTAKTQREIELSQRVEGMRDNADLGRHLLNLADDQARWSRATFGSDSARGPMGALKHLEKEAREAQEKPGDRMEYADCFLLILDAARRAGIGPWELIQSAREKMVINESRAWPKPTSDEPVEHVRATYQTTRHGQTIYQ